jgi:hypothetical protein
MTNAQRDDNNVPTMIAVLNTDGETIVPIRSNPVTRGLKVDDDITGVDNGPDRALRDENFVPTLMATSDADGVTPVAVYTDSSGNLLIDTN